MMCKLTNKQKYHLREMYWVKAENRAVLNLFGDRKRGRCIVVSETAEKAPVAEAHCRGLFETLQNFGLGSPKWRLLLFDIGDVRVCHCDK